MNESQLAALTETHMCECGPDPAHCEADAGPYPCDAAQLLTALADARLEVARLTEAGTAQTNDTRSVERERDQQREDIRLLVEALSAHHDRAGAEFCSASPNCAAALNVKYPNDR